MHTEQGILTQMCDGMQITLKERHLSKASETSSFARSFRKPKETISPSKKSSSSDRA